MAQLNEKNRNIQKRNMLYITLKSGLTDLLLRDLGVEAAGAAAGAALAAAVAAAAVPAPLPPAPPAPVLQHPGRVRRATKRRQKIGRRQRLLLCTVTMTKIAQCPAPLVPYPPTLLILMRK